MACCRLGWVIGGNCLIGEAFNDETWEGRGQPSREVRERERVKARGKRIEWIYNRQNSKNLA